mmetsp:Transcript_71679/g.119236  ORF Transcript_71679/g.119236 Transcript_71679/m.119236 type:complete len:468 (+) Transcript_71679:86-1489(+)
MDCSGRCYGQTVHRTRRALPARAPRGWLSIPRISVKKSATFKGKEWFVREYLDRGIPCIIDDLITDWPAYQQWSPDYFRNEPGVADVSTQIILPSNWEGHPMSSPSQTRMSVGEFVRRIMAGEQLQHFATANFMSDWISYNYKLLSAVRPQTIVERLLPERAFNGVGRMNFSLFPWAPPYPPQVFAAGPNRTSPGHYDADSSHTFHWCVFGRKTVQMIEFTGLKRHFDLFTAYMLRGDVSHHFPAGPPDGLRGWKGDLLTGDILLMPSRIWHWYQYPEVGFSFCLRARSFCSRQGYCDYASDYQNPLVFVQGSARAWQEGFKFNMGPLAARPKMPESVPLSAGIDHVLARAGYAYCPATAGMCLLLLLERQCGMHAVSFFGAPNGLLSRIVHQHPMNESTRPLRKQFAFIKAQLKRRGADLQKPVPYLQVECAAEARLMGCEKVATCPPTQYQPCATLMPEGIAALG